ncbi:hypothetical protein [Cryobacterium sp. N22]|uniref:hypothetical protein n=1 Tax=Cryobacterium sp. N22 TaxID=2048290 RepID=UPI000CE5737A|nr:hypothetical protein [Cryobacterium sp. N22]
MTEPGGTGRPAFDPRHDARFQRGYQPGDASRPPARPPARPGLIGKPPANPAATAAAGADDALDDLDTLAFDGDTFQDELEGPRWNPFIVLLWVLGVVFTVAAVTLQAQAATYSFAGYSYNGNGPLPFGMLIQQLSYSIAPSVLTVGVATLSGLLFWHAWVWRNRRRRSAPSL